MIEYLFFELIRVAIGTQVTLSRPPSACEWKELYNMAKKQSIVGICFAGLQKLYNSVNQELSTHNPQPKPTKNQEPITQNLDEVQYLTWMGMAAKIQQRNEVVNQRCIELHERLKSDGLPCCNLKGQAVANAYLENLKALRQSGDIDVWIKGDAVEVLSYVKKHWPTKKYSYVHTDMNMFNDVEVEAHYRPSSLRNLFANSQFQKWAESFEHFDYDVNTGFCLPPKGFNRIYLIQHCYRHVIGAGIGLRHLLDVYYYLKSTDRQEGEIERLKSFGLYKFASAIMWAAGFVFEGNSSVKSWMICPPNETEGKFLLSQIMAGGNFGKHIENSSSNSAINRIFRNLRYWNHYPLELLWAPIWKIYETIWIKTH